MIQTLVSVEGHGQRVSPGFSTSHKMWPGSGKKFFQLVGIMFYFFFLGGVIIFFCVIILTMVTFLTSVDSFFDSGLPNSVRGLTVDLFLS